MKAKKKPLGTGAQVKAEKEKEGLIATVILLVIILLAAAFSGYFGYTILNSSPGLSFSGPTLQFKPENPNPELKAAIVDQESLTFPNQTFVQAAAHILEQANYSVDYYSGEEVTVDFYRNLATQSYSIVILRVHSTATGTEGTQTVEVPVLLFTSELYSSTKYVQEQLANQVREVLFTGGSQGYFAVGPGFVSSDMKGKLQNTLVIMMGCQGLSNTLMAEAFNEKGARAYISWNSGVSASYTDEATTQLLQHLVTKGQTIKQAVENTIKEVGPDPVYNNTLEYYPLESGNYAIQN
jgi:flagellar basal body-associated protein FliL